MIRFCLLIILTIASLLAVLIATDAVKEGFAATSPGTLLQLRTSHVRTQEDEDDEKIVDEEFNLTSSTESAGGSKRGDSEFLNALMKSIAFLEHEKISLSGNQKQIHLSDTCVLIVGYLL
jgi:hypothetical protein